MSSFHSLFLKMLQSPYKPAPKKTSYDLGLLQAPPPRDPMPIRSEISFVRGKDKKSGLECQGDSIAKGDFHLDRKGEFV